ncbi:MAG: chemotaxis response regulator protein-glutamate methylesterase [Hahellaceae bacterium]|nr:chemotaxis response regulator protein-glutamate methylesterase [Hahellaceae bacterium]
MKKISVLVVDDSELIRRVLSQIINAAADMHVVGTAEDPYDAREKIKQLNPDVLTLDIEMPKMDGISFLRNLMRLRPMPVIMISTLTEKGAPATLEALEIGAVDYLAKPKTDQMQGLQAYTDDIHEKIRAAAGANMGMTDRSRQMTTIRESGVRARNTKYDPRKLIAIGASTGGTEAIKEVLLGMPVNCPPIVISQHIPPVFSTTFAERMNRLCDITVYEAQSGMQLEPGCAYLAPGDFHLVLEKKGARYFTRLLQTEQVNRHRPSVDVMFDSVADLCRSDAVGALLTGMGRDGAAGLLKLKEQGCYTIAQDQATSVVWGMPGAAVQLGAASEVCALEKIHQKVLAACAIR